MHTDFLKISTRLDFEKEFRRRLSNGIDKDRRNIEGLMIDRNYIDIERIKRGLKI